MLVNPIPYWSSLPSSSADIGLGNRPDKNIHFPEKKESKKINRKMHVLMTFWRTIIILQLLLDRRQEKRKYLSWSCHHLVFLNLVWQLCFRETCGNPQHLILTKVVAWSGVVVPLESCIHSWVDTNLKIEIKTFRENSHAHVKNGLLEQKSCKKHLFETLKKIPLIVSLPFGLAKRILNKRPNYQISSN